MKEKTDGHDDDDIGGTHIEHLQRDTTQTISKVKKKVTLAAAAASLALWVPADSNSCG
jgi:hypothetical protein